MSGVSAVILIESIVMAGFAVAAVVGSKSSLWVIVIALFGHGVFDAFHGHVIANPGVPPWWPAFCMAYDIGAAAGLAWLLAGAATTSGVRS